MNDTRLQKPSNTLHSKTMISNSIQHGRRVLDEEAKALSRLSQCLDVNFEKSVELIHDMKESKGRLIVAGIGKSGHVARKIAATLASTGTPSYYVHPGEASHGDMGMITKSDIVLMLSNSGENSELSDLIFYSRRYDIPLIAITSKPESTLGRYADLSLILPALPEACPNGLAPTTSTTMMIALGDALAVALLERMGLTPDDYKVFHPGGKLGQKLLKVQELMVPLADLALVQKETTMDKALLIMAEKNLGAILITSENGSLLGIFTDGDLKRHMAPDLLQKPVSDVMTSTPKTIFKSELAAKAMDIMTRTPGKYLSCLIVVDDAGKLAGLLRLQDCLRAGLT
jgi:arabinose-5-phosphate isomerase